MPIGLILIYLLMKMKNDVLPALPSQLYIFGNNDIQMPISDFSAQMDSKLFPIDSKVFYDLGVGGFAIPSESFSSHHQGPSMTIQRLDYPCSGADYQSPMQSCDITSQPSLLFSDKLSLPQFETGFLGKTPNSSRKRPIEVNDLFAEKGSSDLVGKDTALKNKKQATRLEKPWQNQVKEKAINIHNYRLQMPERRSQKLSDKITALQKLVSPYGKTDTASVLQEACIYIKLLQERIRNMFEMMSSSHANIRLLSPQKTEDQKQLDLRSRGLCLVPVSSITHKLTTEGLRVDHRGVSRKTIIPKNF